MTDIQTVLSCWTFVLFSLFVLLLATAMSIYYFVINYKIINYKLLFYFLLEYLLQNGNTEPKCMGKFVNFGIHFSTVSESI